MKILHIVGACIAGGAEKMAISLAIELNKTTDVRIFFLSKKTDETGDVLLEKIRNSNIKYYQSPEEKVTLKTALYLRDYINDFTPEIIHFHTPNTEKVFTLCKPFIKKKPKLIRTIHNNRGILTISNKTCYLINNKANTIACGPSVSENKQVARFFPNITTIPNGINFDWPIQNTTNKTQLKRKLSLKQDLLHFVCIGRMSGESLATSQKAHDLLIQAWSNSDIRKKSNLHLFGDGNLRPELERLALSSENVFFHGVRGNITEWLQAADVFIMPSRYEGLPIAGIEAAATGLPIIFSQIDPLVKINYKGAIFFKMNDAEDLTNKLNIIEKYKQNSIPHEYANAIRQNYGIESMTKSYLKAYKLMID